MASPNFRIFVIGTPKEIGPIGSRPTPLIFSTHSSPPSSIIWPVALPLIVPSQTHEAGVGNIFLSKMAIPIYSLKFKVPLPLRFGKRFGPVPRYPKLIPFVGFWSMEKF
jgi:hypothetical protein